MNEIKNQKTRLNSLIEKISSLNVINEVCELADIINEMASKYDYYYQVELPARPDWENDEIKGKFKTKSSGFSDIVRFKRYSSDPWEDNDGFEFDLTEIDFFTLMIKGKISLIND